MLKRLLTLLLLFLALIVLFMVQKPMFMLFNSNYATEPLPVNQYLMVMLYGLSLDVSMAAYLMVVPVVVVFVSAFFKEVPLRSVLIPYYMVITMVMALCFVLDAVVYKYTGQKIDASDLIYLDNPLELLGSISKWTVIASLVFFLLAWLFQCRTLILLTPRKLKFRVSLLWMLTLIPVLGFLFLCIRGSVTESTANISFAYHSNNQYVNHSAVNPMFHILYSAFKVEDFAGEFHEFTEQERDRLMEGAYPQTNDVTRKLLKCDTPDIVLVIWEGAGCGYTDDVVVTPRFNELKNEGVYFSNVYANSYRTDRGLVSILNGWLGLPTASLMKLSDKCGYLPSLAKSLKTLNYRTEFIYGGDINFTNMNCYLHETGYDTQKSGSDYGNDGCEAGKWGVHDHIVLADAAREWNGSAGDGKHQFTTVLTLSSHEPWDVPFGKLRDARQNAFAYTDSVLGCFVDVLKSGDRWKNTLLIIVPDHGCVISETQNQSDYHVAHIPMLWLGGAVKEPALVSVLMNQSDLAATLLSQMHIDHWEYPFSRNVLSEKYSDTFVVHTFKNGLNYIDREGVSTYDCVTHESIVTESKSSPPSHINRIKALLQTLYERVADLGR